MNPFNTISAENLHHAYFVVGGEGTKGEIFDFVEHALGLQTVGNPDFSFFTFDTLTVDSARDLAEMQSRKSVSSASSADKRTEKKIFVIQTNIITEEAQNALLKIFEEPTPDTHFFILMPQDILLPTFRSRLQVLNMTNMSRVSLDIKASVSRLTLDTSIAERLAMVKEITEGISDEDKTKQDAISFLNQIESELYQQGVEKNANKLALCQATRNALYDRGAPVKMILEQLVVCL